LPPFEDEVDIIGGLRVESSLLEDIEEREAALKLTPLAPEDGGEEG
jgi:hypothetical protein